MPEPVLVTEPDSPPLPAQAPPVGSGTPPPEAQLSARVRLIELAVGELRRLRPSG
jgi:hypothetical protein